MQTSYKKYPAGHNFLTDVAKCQGRQQLKKSVFSSLCYIKKKAFRDIMSISTLTVIPSFLIGDIFCSRFIILFTDIKISITKV